MSDCYYYTQRTKTCRIGEFNGKPTEENCSSCNMYKGNSRGLGDKVDSLFKKTGIKKVVKAISGGKDCGCGKRRASLNKAFPSKEQKND